MDNVPTETHVVVSVMNNPRETVAEVRDEKEDRLLPHPIRRQSRLTVRDKHPPRDHAIKLCRQEKRNSMPIQNYVKTPSWKFWYPPVCQNYKSESMLTQKESPAKGQRKVVQRDQLRC